MGKIKGKKCTTCKSKKKRVIEAMVEQTNKQTCIYSRFLLVQFLSLVVVRCGIERRGVLLTEGASYELI